MAVTKQSFAGQEQRQWDGTAYSEGDDCEDMLKNVEGAKAMQTSLSKGLEGDTGKPGTMSDFPRALYSAEVGMGVIGDAKHPLVTSGGTLGGTPTGDLHANPASTGKQSLGKPILGSPGEHAPLKTGAGQGQKIVVSYGPGGVGGPAGVTGSSSPLLPRMPFNIKRGTGH